MSTQDRYDRIDALFLACRGLEPAARAAFLDEHCADDDGLRSEVLALLAEDDAPTGPLDRAALGDAVDLAAFDPSPSPPGPPTPPPALEVIGRYRVMERIGEGGMGVVYRAEQDTPRRTVALKVINADLATPSMLRRFEHETHVLGRLQHAGIAQIFEADTFDAGAGPQPYFAMEYIRGEPVTAYATLRDLGTRARLELVSRICDAVQHAHQRGVIHRDLKPANILVDETGQPKILDFGVARATDGDLQTTTLRTDMGQLIGTIPYMSPEQAAGDPVELDTRSDVYALGVIAYELLAGRLPYDVRKKMVHEAVRVIREDEPLPLSSVNRTLGGDVETVVGKALEKDKTRRYQSASAFADDIRRYLNDEPIAARPPSALYQFRKFSQRNRALVVGASAVLVALLLGFTATSIALGQMIRARAAERQQRERAEGERDRAVQARSEAERQRAVAQAINDFLNDDLLAAVDPHNTPEPEVTVRSVLDAAADTIEGRFRTEPLVEAAVRTTLGDTYANLGEYEAAEPHFTAALRLHRGLGPDRPDTLVAMGTLAMLYTDQGRFDEAEPLLRGQLETSRRVNGDEHLDTVDAMTNLANLSYKQGRGDEAETLYAQALDIARRTLGQDHATTIGAMASLALIYQRTDRLDEAEPLSLDAMDGYRRTLGPEHPYTLTATNNLAMLRTDAGRHAEAEPLYLDVLEIRRRTLGDAHPDTLVSMATLARAYRNAGRYAEAEPLALAAYEGLRDVLGADHPYTRIALDLVIGLYERWDRPEQAATYGAFRPAE